MSDLSGRGARRGNGKSDAITGGMIVGMTVYPWDNRCSKLVGINIVKISEADYRDHQDLCLKIVLEALLSLPSGFYTLVNHTEPMPCVMDIRLADKGCGLRLRPFDKETINSIKQPACLRVVVGGKKYDANKAKAGARTLLERLTLQVTLRARTRQRPRYIKTILAILSAASKTRGGVLVIYGFIHSWKNFGIIGAYLRGCVLVVLPSVEHVKQVGIIGENHRVVGVNENLYHGANRPNSFDRSGRRVTRKCLGAIAYCFGRLEILRKGVLGDPTSSNVNRTGACELTGEGLTTDFREICSLEHGTTNAKPPPETSATPNPSVATKTTQARATTRTQSMGETSLKSLKAILETIREQADFALKQLQESEEERSMRWKCKDCMY